LACAERPRGAFGQFGCLGYPAGRSPSQEKTHPVGWVIDRCMVPMIAHIADRTARRDPGHSVGVAHNFVGRTRARLESTGVISSITPSERQSRNGKIGEGQRNPVAPLGCMPTKERVQKPRTGAPSRGFERPAFQGLQHILKCWNPAAHFSSRFVGSLGPRHSTVGANEQCGDVPFRQRQIDSDDFERAFAVGAFVRYLGIAFRQLTLR